MAPLQPKKEGVIEFSARMGDHFLTFEREIAKLWADVVRSETATDAFRNQVTKMAEQVQACAKGAAASVLEGLLLSRPSVRTTLMCAPNL